MAGPDRLEALLAQNDLTGVDFVYVHPGQTELDVYFLTPPLALTQPLTNLTLEQVRIEGDQLPDAEAVALAWQVVDGRDVLRVTTAVPGGFRPYRFYLDDGRIDPFFNGVAFSFKANCPSDLDCAPPPHVCPPEERIDVSVDTTARDFWSIRRALLEFASLRFPDWEDRLEADVGMMMLEVMAGIADEDAYYQDRTARELSLEDATERRSLRAHGRLVDYVVHNGLHSQTLLDFRVKDSEVGPQVLPAGLRAYARGDLGQEQVFEIGKHLTDGAYTVDRDRNELVSHIWDEDSACLPVGATTLTVKGHHEATLPLVDLAEGKPPGRFVLLSTNPISPELPARRLIVRLVEVNDEVDPLLTDATFGNNISRLRWEIPTPYELDLEALTVHGNLVPASAGARHQVVFSIGTSPLPVSEAIERVGPNGTTSYRFTLPDPSELGLCWTGDDPKTAAPELLLEEVDAGPPLTVVATWQWRRSLVGTASSLPDDDHFTLEDGTWDRVVGYRRLGGEVVHRDYQSGSGITIRFGDGEFGRLPATGTLFRATFRLGNGKAGDTAPDVIRELTPSQAPSPPMLPAPAVPQFLERVSNPVASTGGVDPESHASIKQNAPEEFQAVSYRAVRPEDYREAAERLPWVQRAGATFRWTGSWLSAFVTADPKGAVTLVDEQKDALQAQEDRFRQTGREVIVRSPRYADIDLVITLCLEPTSYRGEAIARVHSVLTGPPRADEPLPFFHPDRFSFGTLLDRSELEGAIQQVPGIRAVENIMIRRRGWFGWRLFDESHYDPGDDVVVRLMNDRSAPEQGSLRIETDGGA